MKIAIIGRGELGQALGQILGRAGQSVAFWDKQEEGSLPETLAGAEFIFLCVSSWNVKEALAFAEPYCSSRSIVVLFSKGLDAATGKLPYEIAKKLLKPTVNFAVVSGAMIAEEIGAGKFGACLVASKSSVASKKITALFLPTNLMASASRDLVGVAWVGVLKNIYALALGIVEGLGWTLNERGLLFGQAVEEILRLLKMLGGKKETFLSAPIMADLVATSFDNNSLNHQTGFELGRTGETERKSEGLMSLSPLLNHLTQTGHKIEDFAILNNLAKVIIAGANPREVFNGR